ncbi:hydroxymethylglutaryl-CoA reductase, degradative [Algibacter amylolyticus]|uniref:3-hydroxy-3-methylglutaryl coenzyme A reductase n=1 Tax=Algibacter amylolyticus TaxID=1608400 RepID=A0A5M7AZS4_9FLAO|nr:hydroxymethylglutaryl-CoA reductase, degradative [Algibacter amylolyticus]KAA5820595.1 hydroxymethylglutaryl-CoA reductase, degradative [Algibacter amylolyticus]MBB5269942.1 hydroxymethylglutaryl-CoA reductase [Algibacter amylolyticus]TSJ71268.1 hydroxymethylglutaryl-CoA reductase, degradative [Algibacter amylolyticus]
MSKPITGFSKLSKSKKIDWMVDTYFSNPVEAKAVLKQYWNSNDKLQQLHDEFIENTISNYYLPLGVAPNFLINDKLYTIPMAIEESSVVAAASKAAKFWLERGGFKTTVISTTKIGQVHFNYKGDFEKLKQFFDQVKPKLVADTEVITKNMKKRGGGILDIELRDKTADIDNYYQLHASFETLDAMGANFINSCLEQFAKTFKAEALSFNLFTEEEKHIDIIMSILSNYVPDCLVRAEVSCPVVDLSESKTVSGEAFAKKFIQAVTIAEVEPYRAVTHNKGIMNGIDAVVLATGNDFRAVEAGVHAYASKNGQYSSLTHAKVENGIFSFWMEIPLALGTVGGLTGLHPLVKLALELLHKPSAKDLMQIVAVAGLAQNFAALRSLTTTGIQEGHMKMHLMNILNQFEASTEEKHILTNYFKNNTISHTAVTEALNKLRVSSEK